MCPLLKNLGHRPLVLSLDAMETLIRLKDTPVITYTAFASKMFGMNLNLQMKNFHTFMKQTSSTKPFFGLHTAEGSRGWWREVIEGTVRQVVNWALSFSP